MTADIGRESVYAAELAAFGGTLVDCEVGFDELLWIRNAICASVWWPAGDIDVEQARSDARSSTTREEMMGGLAFVSLHRNAPR